MKPRSNVPMKIVIAFTLALVTLTGCSGSSNSAAKAVYTGGGLKQLKELEGKRVREIGLWEAPDMNDRLGKLVGPDYPKMKDDWLIESPITVSGDTLMVAGCEQNNCDKNQWIMFADVPNDNINVYDIKNGTVKSYKEKGDVALPQPFADEFARLKTLQGVK